MGVIKWYLPSCRVIIRSKIIVVQSNPRSFQTKLHSTQFIYHQIVIKNENYEILVKEYNVKLYNWPSCVEAKKAGLDD